MFWSRAPNPTPTPPCLSRYSPRSAWFRGLIGKEHRKPAESRAKDIARECATATATSAAVSSAVQAVQAAIMVAVLIPAVTATT